MTRYTSDLTTVEAVIRQLAKADPGTLPTAAQAEYDDFFDLLKTDIIPMTSAYILQYCNRAFVPYVETKSYYFRDILRNGQWIANRSGLRLMLDDDLLVTTSITWDGTVMTSTEWRELEPRSLPYWAIEFDEDSTVVDVDTDTFTNSIDVAGIWGYHTNASQMYRQVDASVTINSSSTSLTVTDASLYETLQYIKIESEWMQITSRNETTEVLTVKRGVNGSTAAAHNAVAVSVYNPVDDIRQAATRLASWAYQHRNDLGDRIQFTDGTVVITAMPAFVREVLQNKKRLTYALPVTGYRGI
jgi:hypothetical protein